MIWATIYGWLIFQDLPDKWVIIGASIIISSGLFIVWRETRSNISHNKPVLRARNMRADTGPNPKPKDKIIITDDAKRSRQVGNFTAAGRVYSRGLPKNCN